MKQNPALSLKVLTPESALLEVDEVTSIIVPLSDGGTIGIKPNHGPLIAETTSGFVSYQTENDESRISLHPGVLDIRDNLVLILTPGEIRESSDIGAKPSEIELDRLMKTLMQAFYPADERENASIDNEYEKRTG